MGAFQTDALRDFAHASTCLSKLVFQITALELLTRLFEWQIEPRRRVGLALLTRSSKRQVDLVLIDIGATAEDKQSMYDIFQFAYVTRP